MQGSEAAAPMMQVVLKVPERLLLELTRTLRSAAMSLTDIGAPEAIHGLHAYCLRSFSSLTGLLDGYTETLLSKPYCLRFFQSLEGLLDRSIILLGCDQSNIW